MIKKIFIFILSFQVLNLFSQDVFYYYNKGKEASFNENYNEAIFYFKKSLEINKNFVEPLIELAKIFYELENYDYAYDYINQALKLSTKKDELTIFAADIELKLGRYDIAEKKYKDILAKDPLNLKAYNGLANLYLLTGRNSLAKKSLDEILKTDQNNWLAISMMAKYYELYDKKKAETYYIMNIERNSLNPESYSQYSIYKFNNNDILGAVDNIEMALKISDKIKYKKLYAKYLLFLNRGDEALSLYKEILSKEGEINYLNYYHLAIAYYILNDYEKAINSLKKALGLRDDDEISLYFLSTILVNKFSTDNKEREKIANLFFEKASLAKNESLFDLYINFLKQAIRLFPKIITPRLELADYYKSLKLYERYINELEVASKYTDDIKLHDRIKIEKNSIIYKLGDDWGINQYDIRSPFYSIPLFINKNIENPHYNFERIYGMVLTLISYEKQKYEVILFDEKDYSVSEKLKIAKENNSPFYLDLTLLEGNNFVNVNLKLYNAHNFELLKEYNNYQAGNNRIVMTAINILKKVDNDIPFKAEIIKISKDRAIINAGKRSGLKLKDSFIILKNKNYPIEFKRGSYIYTSDDIKGKGIIVKLDENIAEIKISEQNEYFKDVDVNDIVIFTK